jgi:hypothetical protein
LAFPTFAVVGMLMVLVGSIVTARSVILKDDDAIKIAGHAGLTGYLGDGPPGPTREQYLKQPGVRNLIRQSKQAQLGLRLIALGTCFQILGAIPSFFAG